MTPFLIAKQEGWDAAMRYISKWCMKAQQTIDTSGMRNKMFEEVATIAINLVQTPPKEFE